MPEYVERSYHEALVNALAHRDYLVNGSEVHIDIYDDRLEIYSPGGMPDGSLIQERDPLMVPSTRRNPVLADVLNRLGYMERKGSGFGKIISGYEFQINYADTKKPSFRSDRYQFTVVMPNLNYSVLADNMLIDPKKVAVDGEKVLIESKNLLIQDIIERLNMSVGTKEKIVVLYEKMEDDRIFGRKDIMEIFNISITAAGNLLNHLKKAELITAVKGYGKGKYKFVDIQKE